MSDPKPVLVSLRRQYGVAGQEAWMAEVDYGGETSYVQFVGSPFGAPGPVIMIVNENQTFVTAAGRFGERFGRKWIEAFFASA